jgi:hypothetical protein
MAKKQEWSVESAPTPFDDNGFIHLWVTLLKMPKWAKKPLSAIDMSCNRLKRFDVEFATMLVENAIEGNYQGVVFPDTQQRYEIWKNKKNAKQQQQPITNDKLKDALADRIAQWGQNSGK